jgi:hypothetical protein
MPAKAGIHEHGPHPILLDGCSWIPAFAGMTKGVALVAICLAQPSPSLREGEESGAHP